MLVAPAFDQLPCAQSVTPVAAIGAKIFEFGLVDANEPAAVCVHDNCPDELEKVPVGHATCLLAPILAEVFDLPTAAKKPGFTRVQMDWPTVEEKNPPGHAL